MQENVAALESPQEAGKGKTGVVRRWLMEIELATKAEDDWRRRAERTVNRYKGENARNKSGERFKDNFNILWSNTETLRPSLYNSTPRPDVRRRFKDQDKLGKAVSEVLERCLSYTIDSYEFDGTIQAGVDDYLLPGRAVVRVRYIPTEERAENDTKTSTVVHEEVKCELVNWQKFRHGPGHTWDDVPWIAYEHELTRRQLVDKFGAIGNKVTLGESEEKTKNNDEVLDLFKRGTVWEIWDKEERQILWVAPSIKTQPLKVEADPLNLQGFFDIPRPMISVSVPGSLIPEPEFCQYETLADELDKVTARINRIIKAMKVRGAYDSTLGELSKIFAEDDNGLIPLQESAAAVLERGGLDKAIWMLPIEAMANVLTQLYAYREGLKQAIYELTGISDILRGSSDAGETATAQRIKNQWGTLRLQRRQKEVQRFARDIIRLKAELIAEKFSPETLRLMSGKNFPTAQMKQQAQIAAQTASAMGQQIPPELQDILMQPSWEEIVQVLRNDLMRSYKIDIETDSTIANESKEDKAELVELLQGIVSFVQGIGPAVQMGAVPPETAKSLLLAAVRRFKLGTEVEDSIDKIQAPQPGTNPEQQKAEAESKAKEQELAFKQKQGEQEMALQKQKHAQEMQLEQERMGMEQQKHQAALQMQKEQGDLQMVNKQREADFSLNVKKAETETDAAPRLEAIAGDLKGILGQLAQGMTQLAQTQQQILEGLQMVAQVAGAERETEISRDPKTGTKKGRSRIVMETMQ